MGEITPDLPGNLLAHLGSGAPALLHTAGADGYPSSAYTWAVALGPKTVRFAVDENGTAYANIQRTGLAGLHIIGPGGLAYLVKGAGRKLRDHIVSAAPGTLMLYEMAVMGARDQSFPGVTAKPFTYEWPADRREAMAEMEKAVFAEMKQ